MLAEADGSPEAANRLQSDLLEALDPDALRTYAPVEAAEVTRLWRWRDGVSIAVTSRMGGKVSEDVSVPADRLCEDIEETVAIGARHRLEACSWGHAGDGNLHSTFMLARGDEDALSPAEAAAADLFALAVRLGGSVSGGHGIGWTKRGRLALQLAPPHPRDSLRREARVRSQGAPQPRQEALETSVKKFSMTRPPSGCRASKRSG